MTRYLTLSACIGLFVLLVSPLAAQNPAGQNADSRQSYLALAVQTQVIVSDAAEAADAVTEWAESEGGYFVSKALDHVSLRLPRSTPADVRNVVDAVALDLVTFDPMATDLRTTIVDLQAGITSRRDSLERIVEYVRSANVQATLAFEKELNAILNELDNLEGRLRLANHRIDYLYVDIWFSAAGNPIPQSTGSSFDWINTVDLYQFLREVQR